MARKPYMRSSGFILAALAFCYAVFTFPSCKHEPILSDLVDPMDTINNPIDTMPGDSTIIDPCDPDSVYFETQVLPILISNCTVPGCHDPAGAQKDVILTSYDNVIASKVVRAFNLGGSDLFERIVHSDPDKRMPPMPRDKLTQEQIQLIADWISQGAQNLSCNDGPACDTEAVSFATDINAIISTRCRGCHSGSIPAGNVDLTGYAGISAVAQDGRLYGVTARLPGFVPMPRNAAKIPDCDIAMIKAWIDAGSPNN